MKISKYRTIIICLLFFSAFAVSIISPQPLAFCAEETNLTTDEQALLAQLNEKLKDDSSQTCTLYNSDKSIKAVGQKIAGNAVLTSQYEKLFSIFAVGKYSAWMPTYEHRIDFVTQTEITVHTVYTTTNDILTSKSTSTKNITANGITTSVKTEEERSDYVNYLYIRDSDGKEIAITTYMKSTIKEYSENALAKLTVTEYTFENNVKVKAQSLTTMYDSTGAIMGYVENIYVNGKIAQVNNYDENMTLSGRSEYTYFDENIATITSYKIVDGKATSDINKIEARKNYVPYTPSTKVVTTYLNSETIEYLNDGTKRLTVTTYRIEADKARIIDSKNIYTYDANKMMIKFVEYTYYSNGKVFQINTYNNDTNKVLSSCVEYFYNENGTVSQTNTYTYGAEKVLSNCVKCTYENGNIAQITSYKIFNGEVTSEIVKVENRYNYTTYISASDNKTTTTYLKTVTTECLVNGTLKETTIIYSTDSGVKRTTEQTVVIYTKEEVAGKTLSTILKQMVYSNYVAYVRSDNTEIYTNLSYNIIETATNSTTKETNTTYIIVDGNKKTSTQTVDTVANGKISGRVTYNYTNGNLTSITTYASKDGEITSTFKKVETRDNYVPYTYINAANGKEIVTVTYLNSEVTEYLDNGTKKVTTTSYNVGYNLKITDKQTVTISTDTTPSTNLNQMISSSYTTYTRASDNASVKTYLDYDATEYSENGVAKHTSVSYKIENGIKKETSKTVETYTYTDNALSKHSTSTYISGVITTNHTDTYTNNTITSSVDSNYTNGILTNRVTYDRTQVPPSKTKEETFSDYTTYIKSDNTTTTTFLAYTLKQYTTDSDFTKTEYVYAITNSIKTLSSKTSYTYSNDKLAKETIYEYTNGSLSKLTVIEYNADIVKQTIYADYALYSKPDGTSVTTYFTKEVSEFTAGVETKRTIVKYDAATHAIKTTTVTTTAITTDGYDKTTTEIFENGSSYASTRIIVFATNDRQNTADTAVISGLEIRTETYSNCVIIKKTAKYQHLEVVDKISGTTIITDYTYDSITGAELSRTEVKSEITSAGQMVTTCIYTKGELTSKIVSITDPTGDKKDIVYDANGKIISGEVTASQALYDEDGNFIANAKITDTYKNGFLISKTVEYLNDNNDVIETMSIEYSETADMVATGLALKFTNEDNNNCYLYVQTETALSGEYTTDSMLGISINHTDPVYMMLGVNYGTNMTVYYVDGLPATGDLNIDAATHFIVYTCSDASHISADTVFKTPEELKNNNFVKSSDVTQTYNGNGNLITRTEVKYFYENYNVINVEGYEFLNGELSNYFNMQAINDTIATQQEIYDSLTEYEKNFVVFKDPSTLVKWTDNLADVTIEELKTNYAAVNSIDLTSYRQLIADLQGLLTQQNNLYDQLIRDGGTPEQTPIDENSLYGKSYNDLISIISDLNTIITNYNTAIETLTTTSLVNDITAIKDEIAVILIGDGETFYSRREQFLHKFSTSGLDKDALIALKTQLTELKDVISSTKLQFSEITNAAIQNIQTTSISYSPSGTQSIQMQYTYDADSNGIQRTVSLSFDFISEDGESSLLGVNWSDIFSKSTDSYDYMFGDSYSDNDVSDGMQWDAFANQGGYFYYKDASGNYTYGIKIESTGTDAVFQRWEKGEFSTLYIPFDVNGKITADYFLNTIVPYFNAQESVLNSFAELAGIARTSILIQSTVCDSTSGIVTITCANGAQINLNAKYQIDINKGYIITELSNSINDVTSLISTVTGLIATENELYDQIKTNGMVLPEQTPITKTSTELATLNYEDLSTLKSSIQTIIEEYTGSIAKQTEDLLNIVSENIEAARSMYQGMVDSGMILPAETPITKTSDELAAMNYSELAALNTSLQSMINDYNLSILNQTASLLNDVIAPLVAEQIKLYNNLINARLTPSDPLITLDQLSTKTYAQLNTLKSELEKRNTRYTWVLIFRMAQFYSTQHIADVTEIAQNAYSSSGYTSSDFKVSLDADGNEYLSEFTLDINGKTVIASFYSDGDHLLKNIAYSTATDDNILAETYLNENYNGQGYGRIATKILSETDADGYIGYTYTYGDSESPTMTQNCYQTCTSDTNSASGYTLSDLDATVNYVYDTSTLTWTAVNNTKYFYLSGTDTLWLALFDDKYATTYSEEFGSEHNLFMFYSYDYSGRVSVRHMRTNNPNGGFYFTYTYNDKYTDPDDPMFYNPETMTTHGAITDIDFTIRDGKFALDITESTVATFYYTYDTTTGKLLSSKRYNSDGILTGTATYYDDGGFYEKYSPNDTADDSWGRGFRGYNAYDGSVSTNLEYFKGTTYSTKTRIDSVAWEGTTYTYYKTDSDGDLVLDSYGWAVTEGFKKVDDNGSCRDFKVYVIPGEGEKRVNVTTYSVDYNGSEYWFFWPDSCNSDGSVNVDYFNLASTEVTGVRTGYMYQHWYNYDSNGNVTNNGWNKVVITVDPATSSFSYPTCKWGYQTSLTEKQMKASSDWAHMFSEEFILGYVDKSDSNNVTNNSLLYAGFTLPDYGDNTETMDWKSLLQDTMTFDGNGMLISKKIYDDADDSTKYSEYRYYAENFYKGVSVADNVEHGRLKKSIKWVMCDDGEKRQVTTTTTSYYNAFWGETDLPVVQVIEGGDNPGVAHYYYFHQKIGTSASDGTTITAETDGDEIGYRLSVTTVNSEGEYSFTGEYRDIIKNSTTGREELYYVYDPVNRCEYWIDWDSTSGENIIYKKDLFTSIWESSVITETSGSGDRINVNFTSLTWSSCSDPGETTLRANNSLTSAANPSSINWMDESSTTADDIITATYTDGKTKYVQYNNTWGNWYGNLYCHFNTAANGNKADIVVCKYYDTNGSNTYYNDYTNNKRVYYDYNYNSASVPNYQSDLASNGTAIVTVYYNNLSNYVAGGASTQAYETKRVYTNATGLNEVLFVNTYTNGVISSIDSYSTTTVSTDSHVCKYTISSTGWVTSYYLYTSYASLNLGAIEYIYSNIGNTSINYDIYDLTASGNLSYLKFYDINRQYETGRAYSTENANGEKYFAVKYNGDGTNTITSYAGWFIIPIGIKSEYTMDSTTNRVLRSYNYKTGVEYIYLNTNTTICDLYSLETSGVLELTVNYDITTSKISSWKYASAFTTGEINFIMTYNSDGTSIVNSYNSSGKLIAKYTLNTNGWVTQIDNYTENTRTSYVYDTADTSTNGDLFRLKTLTSALTATIDYNLTTGKETSRLYTNATSDGEKLFVSKYNTNGSRTITSYSTTVASSLGEVSTYTVNANGYLTDSYVYLGFTDIDFDLLNEYGIEPYYYIETHYNDTTTAANTGDIFDFTAAGTTNIKIFYNESKKEMGRYYGTGSTNAEHYFSINYNTDGTKTIDSYSSWILIPLGLQNEYVINSNGEITSQYDFSKKTANYYSAPIKATGGIADLYNRLSSAVVSMSLRYDKIFTDTQTAAYITENGYTYSTTTGGQSESYSATRAYSTTTYDNATYNCYMRTITSGTDVYGQSLSEKRLYVETEADSGEYKLCGKTIGDTTYIYLWDTGTAYMITTLAEYTYASASGTFSTTTANTLNPSVSNWSSQSTITNFFGILYAAYLLQSYSPESITITDYNSTSLTTTTTSYNPNSIDASATTTTATTSEISTVYASALAAAATDETESSDTSTTEETDNSDTTSSTIKGDTSVIDKQEVESEQTELSKLLSKEGISDTSTLKDNSSSNN